MSERWLTLIGRAIGCAIWCGMVIGLMYWMGAPRWACIGVSLLSMQLVEINSKSR